MKSYILLLGLLLGGFTAYADSTAKKETEAILIGHVVDSRSGEHLPFITITVKGTTIGTTTDVSGHYLLGNLPVGRAAHRRGAVGRLQIRRTERHARRPLHHGTEFRTGRAGRRRRRSGGRDRPQLGHPQGDAVAGQHSQQQAVRTDKRRHAGRRSEFPAGRARRGRMSRTAASRRYASTVWTATIRKSCSTRGRSSRPSTASTVSNRFPPT